MPMVNTHEAKTHLSRLLERSLAGAEIVIAKAGKALVRLVPVGKLHPRRPGLAKGAVTRDLFDRLPEEELAAFETN